MVDRFPEAFERFERVVDIDRFESYKQLLYSFSLWAGKRWIDSYAQNQALKDEAQKRGFRDAVIPMYLMRSHDMAQRRTVVRHRQEKEGRVVRVKSSVRSYVEKGYSANEIQRLLRQRGIGIRRKTLLQFVRETKGKSARANREKYIRKKYRR